MAIRTAQTPKKAELCSTGAALGFVPDVDVELDEPIVAFKLEELLYIIS